MVISPPDTQIMCLPDPFMCPCWYYGGIHAGLVLGNVNENSDTIAPLGVTGELCIDLSWPQLDLVVVAWSVE